MTTGALEYTTTPVTATDKLATVAKNGSVVINAVTGAAGGTGTVVLDTDDYFAPRHGEVSLNAGTGEVTFTPSLDFEGVDEFYVFVKSANQFATVRINVLVGAGGSISTPVVDTACPLRWWHGADQPSR